MPARKLEKLKQVYVEVGVIALALDIYPALGSRFALCPKPPAPLRSPAGPRTSVGAAGTGGGYGSFWLWPWYPPKPNPAKPGCGSRGSPRGCEQAASVLRQALRCGAGDEGVSVSRGGLSSLRCLRCPGARARLEG